MFNSQQPQQKSVQPSTLSSNIRNKRTTFRQSIRRSQINEQHAKIRDRMMYKTDMDYNLLKEIRLEQTLKTFINEPINPIKGLNVDEEFLDESQLSPTLKRCIDEIFLYVTSSERSHAILLMDEPYIKKLIDLLSRGVIRYNQHRQQYEQQQQNYRQRLQEQHSRLFTQQSFQPTIIRVLQNTYEKVLHILTAIVAVSYQNCHSKEYFDLLCQIIGEILKGKISSSHNSINNIQTSALTDCFQSISLMIENKSTKQDLLRMIDENSHSSCVVSQVVRVLQEEISLVLQNINAYSERLILSCLEFLKNLFGSVDIMQIYPLLRQKILHTINKIQKCFHSKFATELQFSLILIQNTGLIDQLIRRQNQDFVPAELILEMSPILIEMSGQISLLTHYMMGHSNSNNKIVHKMRQNTEIECLFKEMVSILSLIVNCIDVEPIEDQRIFGLFKTMLCEYLIFAFQNGVKDGTQQYITACSLRLANSFIESQGLSCFIFDSDLLRNKIFSMAQDRKTPFLIRVEAINCMCSFVMIDFQGFSYSDPNLRNKYEIFYEGNRIVDVMVEVFDDYNDVGINWRIILAIEILCLFWECDPDVERPNKFWEQFVDRGGLKKLERYVNYERNDENEEAVRDLLDKYQKKDEQIEI